MKHRFLSALLILALLATMIVAPVGAWSADESTTSLTRECPCGCGKSLAEVEWRAWDANNTGDPEPGHYYLEDNYVQKEQLTIISGNKVVLDLRGHTLTTDDYHRLFLLYGYLAVMDSVGGGRFSAKTTGAGYGGIVMVSTNETNDSTFELYSGTITPDADNKGSRRGGLIQVYETATFRMYGGRLMNGTTVSTSNPDKKEPGGCIAGASAACTIEILGGEILGGESSTSGGNIYSVGTTILKNCKIIGGTATTYGGNIYQSGGSLTIENCTISDGVSGSSGGNIYVTGSTVLTVKGSTLRNGYADNYGGNLYMGAASGTIENTEIFSGVSANRGNNIYGSTSATALTVKDCQIPGDVAYIGKGLTLEGLVKIGLLNNGLKLWYGTNVSVVSASGLTDGSEIYVDATGTFTDAGVNAAYFKGAMRTVLAESAEGLVATQAAAGEQGGYCPHCGEQVTWQAFSLTGSLVQNCLLDTATDEDPACTGRHIASGHYYLPASLTGIAQYYVGAYLSASGTLQTDDVVLDLNGCDVTATGRFFYLRPKDADGNTNKLTVLDSVGGSVVTGRGANNQGGGVIYNEGSKLTIYGGKYVYNPVSGRNVTGAGVIQGGSEFTMHGGILDGSAFTYTDASTTEKTYTYNGGALNMGSGSTKTFTMTAGCILGGTAQSGGGVYFGYNNKVYITGGQFIGGTANVDYGGNIRLYSTSQKDGVFNMSNASVIGGTATTAGGNLYLQYYTTELKNCYINGGQSADYGGNLNCGSSSANTITDCLILNGSGKRSGNIHVAATSATLTMNSCLVTNGTATTYSGNINAGNGNIDIVGGEISFGTAGTYAGNIAVTAGNTNESNYTRFSADDNGNAPRILSGTAATNGGNLYVGGITYLDAAFLANGSAKTLGQDIYLIKASTRNSLEIGTAVTCDISMGVVATLLGTGVYGAAIERTSCDQLNAKITLEGDYGKPMLCVKDGALCVGATTVVDSLGNATWYADNASAIDACGADCYVKLYTDADVVLTKDCTVDVNGHSVNVSGAYTVKGMDSTGGGSIALAASTTSSTDYTDPNGNRYLAVIGNGTVTYHLMNMQITGVSLRPSKDGIYYTAKWTCDSTVEDMIESYGVAVSLNSMPDTNFQGLSSGSLWTSYDRDTFVSGEGKTSAMIGGIMKTAEQGRTAEMNNQYGNMPIYANAYVILTDGTVLMGQDNIAYSLYDVMAALDGLIESDPLNYRIYTNPARAFYEKWQDFGMDSWKFNKIPKPEDDGVIDILMIGGSFSYYYVEELYGLAAAAGIPMRVCNLYYSGAGPKQHWTWWKNGQSPCQFFSTDGNGRVVTNNVSLEWALAQDDWDILELQYPSATVRTNTPEEGFEDNKLYTDELVAYLQEQFPDAQLYWQQVWAYQVGFDRDGYQVPDRTEQLALYQRHKELANIATEAYDLPLFPSGDAWEIVRSQYGYDSLCARLGKGTNNEGDYYHDGDIGGGQYLNACVWFEIITGQSVVGNTYTPTYTYGGTQYGLNAGITATDLQNAAHQAVEAYRAKQAQ